jgi:hypothetical protein
MKNFWREALAALVLSVGLQTAHAAVDLEGVHLEDTASVGGSQLVLNGAAVQKRGYFKTIVVGFYLSTKRNSLEAVSANRLKDTSRFTIVMLRDLPTSLMSRYFISDFKQAATEAEFKLVIDDVGRTGQIYGNLSSVRKGDVVNVDTIPGRGVVVALNGHVVGTTTVNPLYSDIFLRMYMGSHIPQDFRDGLLGLTK